MVKSPCNQPWAPARPAEAMPAERGGRKEAGRRPEAGSRREGLPGSCAAASAQVQGGWKLPDHRPTRASSLCLRTAAACRQARPNVNQRRPFETETPLPNAAFCGRRTPAMDPPEGRSAGAAAPRSCTAALGRDVAAQSPHHQHGCRIHPSSARLTPEGTVCPEQGPRSHSCKERPKSAAPNPPAVQPPCHRPAAPWEPQLVVPPARTPQPWGHCRAPG